jgi:hypothetical protein
MLLPPAPAQQKDQRNEQTDQQNGHNQQPERLLLPGEQEREAGEKFRVGIG